LHELKTQHTNIEVQGALEIGDLEMDVADADTGGDGRVGRHDATVADGGTKTNTGRAPLMNTNTH
jgi:hypothetical protein